MPASEHQCKHTLVAPCLAEVLDKLKLVSMVMKQYIQGILNSLLEHAWGLLVVRQHQHDCPKPFEKPHSCPSLALANDVL